MYITIKFGDGIDPFTYEYDPNFKRNTIDHYYAYDAYNNGDTSIVIDFPYTGDMYREYIYRLKLFDNLRKSFELNKIQSLRKEIVDCYYKTHNSDIRQQIIKNKEKQIDKLINDGISDLPIELYHRVSMSETKFYNQRYIIKPEEHYDQQCKDSLNELLRDGKLASIVETKIGYLVHLVDIPDDDIPSELSKLCDHKLANVIKSSKKIEKNLEDMYIPFEMIFNDYYEEYQNSISYKNKDEEYAKFVIERMYNLVLCASFIDNKTALKTTTKMIGDVIKKCNKPEDARYLCGFEYELDEEENKELLNIKNELV